MNMSVRQLQIPRQGGYHNFTVCDLQRPRCQCVYPIRTKAYYRNFIKRSTDIDPTEFWRILKAP